MSCAGRQAGRDLVRGLLLIEDDPYTRRSIRRWIPDIEEASTYEEAETKVNAHEYLGVIADVGMDGCVPKEGDRTGIDHAEIAHAKGARVMILSAFFASPWRARADVIRAQYVLKPFKPWLLLAFRDHCYGASSDHVDDDLRAALEVAIVKYGWTAAWAAVALLCAQGHAPKAIATIRGTSLKTIQNHVAGILETTGDDHLWQVGMRLQSEARAISLLRNRK